MPFPTLSSRGAPSTAFGMKHALAAVFGIVTGSVGLIQSDLMSVAKVTAADEILSANTGRHWSDYKLNL
jgi:hypothetical protein